MEYLESKYFNFYTGGYDDESEENEAKVKAYISEMKGK